MENAADISALAGAPLPALGWSERQDGPPPGALIVPDQVPPRPGGNPGANIKSISHRCHPILVAFVWELTKETIYLPMGCLQGGSHQHEAFVVRRPRDRLSWEKKC